MTAESEEHEGKHPEPSASLAAARCPSPTAPPETKLLVAPLRRLLVPVLRKAAGWMLRVDERARTDLLMLALTSNAYHTVAEQGAMAL